jgi:pyruvate/2-oxoacid:ferredoxin oxidoreductase beta subunit
MMTALCPHCKEQLRYVGTRSFAGQPLEICPGCGCSFGIKTMRGDDTGLRYEYYVTAHCAERRGLQ